MRPFATLAFALMPATMAASPAIAASAPAPDVVSRAPRGASGAFEITYDAAPLRAKATSDLSAPVLVRLTNLAPGRHRIEYLGLVSGTYDLAAYVEQVDGRAATFASPLEVEVFTQLPPGHGTDVFGVSAPSFGLRGGYRELLVALGALWLLVPAVAIGVRLARRRPLPTPVPAVRGPSLAERLFAIVDEGRARGLTVDERGRLELLLLRTLREHAGLAGGSPAELAAAVEAVRRDARDGPVIGAVERWLHARDSGEERAALAAIEGLRTPATATPRVEAVR